MNDCTSQDNNRGPTLILMILAPELRRGLPCKVPTSAREAPRQLARPSALREVSLYLLCSLASSPELISREPWGGVFK